MKINPRYVAYAASFGMTPDEAMQYDEIRYPGGCMSGFILWISSSLAGYRAQDPDAFLHGNLVNQDGFTDYLRGLKK